MKVVFLLTEPTLHIVGGYKMVYLYSNYLASVGHEVIIDYVNFPRKVKDYIYAPARRYICQKDVKWFPLDKTVKKRYIFYNHKGNLDKGDCYILTASFLANKLFAKLEGEKVFHLIQDHETWAVDERILHRVYSLNTKKIVVSNWLKKIVDEYSPYKAIVISNGIDINVFKIHNKIESRNNHSVIMLYHSDLRKGCKRGILILEQLKKEFPDLNCIMFGSPKRSKEIPSWINYYRNVNQYDLAKLYNQCAIFICCSYFEGFGLTGLESMACGCALVSTDTKGVKEYAKDNYNALLSDPENDESLLNNVKCLLLNSDLRIRLAYNSQKEINSYSQKIRNVQFLKNLI